MTSCSVPGHLAREGEDCSVAREGPAGWQQELHQKGTLDKRKQSVQSNSFEEAAEINPQRLWLLTSGMVYASI